MPDLQWIRHRYGGHTAPVIGGHYLVQADPVYRHNMTVNIRYHARLVQAGAPGTSLGHHTTRAQAEQACQEHHNRRSRWDEDIEAGAI